MAAVDHQVRRVGDRQHEAGRIGDEGADQQIRQRLLGLDGGGHRGHRRGQHDGGGVVGQEDRHDRANEIDQREQPRGRAVRHPRRARGQPVEQTLRPGQFGQQHHTDEEQVNIRALGDAPQRIAGRHEAQRQQRDGAGDGPHRLRQAPGPQNHAGGRGAGDQPGGKVRVHHARPLRFGPNWVPKICLSGHAPTASASLPAPWRSGAA